MLVHRTRIDPYPTSTIQERGNRPNVEAVDQPPNPWNLTSTSSESLDEPRKCVPRENETILAVRVASPGGRFIDYRLNILGIRVWENSCQLISRSGEEWTTIGPRWDLPMHVPQNSEELRAAAAEPLRLTAYQYCADSPGSDLARMLSQVEDFSVAMLLSRDPD